MPDKLCEFTTEGISAFSKWLRSGAPGSVPDDLFHDPVFSNPYVKRSCWRESVFPIDTLLEIG